MSEWISVTEAAQRLGISQLEMSRLMVSGQITSTAGGKVNAQAVAVLAAQRGKSA